MRFNFHKRTAGSALISGAAAVACIFSLAPAAQAVTAPRSHSEEVALDVNGAADREAAFASLSPADQRIFAERMKHWTPVEDTSKTRTWRRTPTANELAAMGGSPGVTSATSGCWSQYKYYTWDDLEIDEGSTWMTANWCSKSSRITSYSLTGQGGQGYLGIKYDGLGNRYTNNVGWEVRQGQQFLFSVLWASAQPCMQIRGGATGLYSFRPDCNMG